MKKTLLLFCVSIFVLGCFSGCTFSGSSTYMAYTFSVDTGDDIRIELDTTGGYDMTSDLPLEISENGQTLSQGVFLTAEEYEDYFIAASTDLDATVIDSGNTDSLEYIFWSYNDAEFNYAILFNGTNTGFLLGNNVSEDSARECFNRLSFSVE